MRPLALPPELAPREDDAVADAELMAELDAEEAARLLDEVVPVVPVLADPPAELAVRL